MISADESGKLLGDTQIYICYNNSSFGDSIYANSIVEIVKGTLIDGELIPGIPLYAEPIIGDNSAQCLGIQTNFLFSSSLPDLGSPVSEIPTQLLHVKISILNNNEPAVITFLEDLMTGQQYESDNLTLFSPVTAIDTLFSPLFTPSVPVINGIQIINEGTQIQICWTPETNISYKIFSSDNPYNGFSEETGVISEGCWTGILDINQPFRFYYLKAYNE
ncbi:MAG: hypothetical protein JW996_03390 [Candidatus Cloacimonetes bacterium]|nr:hypothetical protein [Candidatus Cloacimonadota bacterium]